jgi:NAD(P)-dependent dehydrogenase (short-subunit alcohol dehydrogenase family)
MFPLNLHVLPGACSTSGKRSKAGADMAAYTATKFAVRGLMQAAGNENRVLGPYER